MEEESGFTLIELVVVIVILGILAATALPKFVDLTGDAEQAAVKGVAGAVSSAASVNYAASKVGNAGAATVNSCDDMIGLVQGVTLQTTASTNDQTFQIGNTACASGSAACTITSKGGKTATATIVCTN